MSETRSYEFLDDINYLGKCCEASLWLLGHRYSCLNGQVDREVESNPLLLRLETGSFTLQRTPKIDGQNAFVRLIKTIVFLSSNQSLNSFHDEALRDLVDVLQEIDPLTRFAGLVSKYNLYWLVQQILEIQNITTEIFAGNLLPTAVEAGDTQLVRLLLRGECPLDALIYRQFDLWSALGIAVLNKEPELVSLLLEAGADPYHGVSSRVLRFWNQERLPQATKSFQVFHYVLDAQMSAYMARRKEWFWKEKRERERQWEWLILDTLEKPHYDICKLYLDRLCKLFDSKLQKLLLELATASPTDDMQLIEIILCKLLESKPDFKYDSLCRTMFIAFFCNALLQKNFTVAESLLKFGPRLCREYWEVAQEAIVKTLKGDDTEVLSLVFDSNHSFDTETLRQIWETALRRDWINVFQFLIARGLDIHGDYTRICLYYDDPSKHHYHDHTMICPAYLHVSLHNYRHDDEILTLLISNEIASSRDQRLCLLVAGAEAGDLSLIHRIVNNAGGVESIIGFLKLPDFLIPVLRNTHSAVMAWVLDSAITFEVLNELLSKDPMCSHVCPWPSFGHSPRLLEKSISSGLKPSRGLLSMCALSCSPEAEENMHIVIKAKKSSGSPFSAKDITICFLFVLRLLSNPVQDCGFDKLWSCSCRKGNDYDFRHVKPLRALAELGAAPVEPAWVAPLFRAGAPVDDVFLWETIKRGTRPTHSAVITKRVSMLKYLLETGFACDEYDVKPIQDTTPLQLAATMGSIDICRLLLQYGADVNASAHSPSGRTALQGASYSGNFQLVLELIQAGADINAAAAIELGATALEMAASTGHLEIIHLLMKNNTDLPKLKKDCKRASRFAQKYHGSIARMLEEHARKLADRVGLVYEDEVDEMCTCEILREPRGECSECGKGGSQYSENCEDSGEHVEDLEDEDLEE